MEISSPSRYTERGSAQQGPELRYSQGAWRLGNITAKSVNCISHRSLSKQQKKIICSQTWSSKVQIRNRIKTPSIQGHLSPFSPVAWRPHFILLLPPLPTVRSPWPWAVPDARGGGEASNKPKEVCLLHKFRSLRVEVKHFSADLIGLHWHILRDSAQISLSFKNVHVRYHGVWYLSMSIQSRHVPGSAGAGALWPQP